MGGGTGTIVTFGKARQGDSTLSWRHADQSVVLSCPYEEVWGFNWPKPKYKTPSFFVPTVLSTMMENFTAVNVNIPTYAPPASNPLTKQCWKGRD